MDIHNTDEDYGLLAKVFHWIIAVLILGLIPAGFFMTGMENSPVKFEIYALHKSFGLLVFFLGLGRIAWRFISPPPDHLENHKPWELKLAGASHFWLYVCMIGMPLTGWLMSSAGQFPIPFFGIQLPAITPANEDMAGVFNLAHETLAYTLVVILGLHMAGALKHHVIDRDLTLDRMTWIGAPRLLVPVLVILIAGASYAISGLSILRGEEEEHDSAAAKTEASTDAGAMPDTPTLPPSGWAIVPARSNIEFEALLYNAPFRGEFHDFSGTIIFDPADLTTARADIRIGMNDISSGDSERDKNMKGSEWFDSEQFPESRFVAEKFENAGEHSYVAIGNLTIRDRTMPLIIPFELTIKDNEAQMSGKVTLNRSDFGIGTGQWEGDETVGLSVDVFISVTAVR